jgi:hypothetical protein
LGFRRSSASLQFPASCIVPSTASLFCPSVCCPLKSTKSPQIFCLPPHFAAGFCLTAARLIGLGLFPLILDFQVRKTLSRVAATSLVWAVFVLCPITQFFLLLGDFLLTAAQLNLFIPLPAFAAVRSGRCLRCFFLDPQQH